MLYMDMVKIAVSPIFLVITILGVGILLLIIWKKKRLSLSLISISFVLLFLFSFRPFANFLIWTLERQFPPLDSAQLQNVEYLVVLTSWASGNETLPYTSQIGYRSAFRVLEANRLYKFCSACRIVISGGKEATRLMGKLSGLLGVPEDRIILENRSRTTWESAENVSALIGDHTFVLITNAYHMPRAMAAFKSAGLKPLAGPADFNYGYYKKFPFSFLNRSFAYFLPNLESLRLSTWAFHEYIGLIWYEIKGLY